MHPLLFEVSTAHEEGGQREFLASTVEFLADNTGAVRGITVAETEYVNGRRLPKPGSERELPADLVLLALGFIGTDTAEVESELSLSVDSGIIVRDPQFQSTSPGIFVAGDAGRGQSLIVWAIAEGRATAAAVDRYLEGGTDLPSPIAATDRAISL
jgi:glutamate synthase (NADPH/NADH) small chain